MATPDTPAEAPALYLPDGARVIPTALTMGPWDQGLQFGGAVAALTVWAAERVPTLVPMQVTRLTIDLMRPVPIRPLTVATRVVREGKRLQVVEVVVRHEDLEVAWASVLRLQLGDLGDLTGVEVPAGLPAPDVRPVPRDPTHCVYSQVPEFLPGICGAVDFWAPEEVTQAFRGPTWVRPKVPVVAGDPRPPIAGLVLVADFSSGMGLPTGTPIRGINADLTVNVVRPPTDDWIMVDGDGWSSPDAIGLSRSTLSDRRGVLAAAICSRLLTRGR